VAAFHDAHQRIYGYSFRDDPTQQVEWVNLRVTGIGPIRRPTLQPAPTRSAPHPQASGAPEREGNPQPEQVRAAVHSSTPPPPPTHMPPSPSPIPSATPPPTPVGSRPVCFDPDRGFVDTAVYRRNDLYPGDVVNGPVVVEEYGATVPLHPGFRAAVDRLGNLIVSREDVS
jgi:N-methylhydantoinase A